jgi:hypothetical protein
VQDYALVIDKLFASFRTGPTPSLSSTSKTPEKQFVRPFNIQDLLEALDIREEQPLKGE